MREILFRAKRKDTGEWVEGLLWKKKYNSNKIFISCFPNKDDDEEVFVIDPGTICQYTGLTDVIGAKIFEGDIIVTRYGLFKRVEYNRGGFSPFSVAGWECVPRPEEVQVVGNIFDKPAFLEAHR